MSGIVLLQQGKRTEGVRKKCKKGPPKKNPPFGGITGAKSGFCNVGILIGNGIR
jgi:hypothetical protein